MKHVLVTVDGREMTASRKKEAVDLVTMWKEKLTHEKVPYQLAIFPLDIGDVWISVTDEPVSIPAKYRFDNVVPASAKQLDGPPEMSLPSLDSFFSLPTETPSITFGKQDNMIEEVKKQEQNAEFPPRATIVIERKALADLKSSYSDGRYKDQKARLINCDADMVVLLVEGYVGSKVKEDAVKQRFLSTFVHTMFRDKISVYHTPCIQDSFEWIEWTCHEMATGKLERTAEYMERTKYTDNIKMSRKANLTADHGLELQLASIPGISAKMARAVNQKYPSMMHLCKAYAEVEANDASDSVQGNGEYKASQLLADITFRGPSGKEQRLATRSTKIYQYVTGKTEDVVKPPPKKKVKKNPPM